MAIYMASSTPTTTTEFDENNPSFYVGGGGGHEADVVRRHVTKPYIYYLGSHEGCGCGFRREGHDYVVEPEEAAARVKTHQELASFISRILETQPFVELYTCWEGEEHFPIDTRRTITVKNLTYPDFIFDFNELILVYAR